MENKSDCKGSLKENKNRRHAELDSAPYLVSNTQSGEILKRVQDDTIFYNIKAFTLIELLVVVLIIGILAAVAVPQYQKAVMKSRFMQLKTLAHAIAQAQERYYLANGQYSLGFEELDIDLPAYSSTETNTASFSWGSCWMAPGDGWGSRVGCSDTKDGLTYYIYFQYSSFRPGERMCRALNTNLSSPQNQLCKADSGGKRVTNSTDIDWYY